MFQALVLLMLRQNTNERVLADIESGKIPKEWMEEAKSGAKLKQNREALGSHPIEIVGKEIRALEKNNKKRLF